MTLDLTFELSNMRDESPVDRSGKLQPVKVATFYLGKFGPFVERVPADQFSDVELRRRVDALKLHLTNISQA